MHPGMLWRPSSLLPPVPSAGTPASPPTNDAAIDASHYAFFGSLDAADEDALPLDEEDEFTLPLDAFVPLEALSMHGH